MTSVLLVLFLSQARIFMAMARDGLLPGVFGTVHPRFRTPHVATMVTGVVICLVAALTPIKKLEEMVNVGTLMAFVMVCAAVLILRIQRPDATRPFRCPVDLAGGAAGDARQPDADAVPAAGHLAAAGDLAADRVRDLLRLQPPPQPSDQAPAARDSGPARRAAWTRRTAARRAQDSSSG